MMKEKDIRTFLPFLIVFVSTFFLSGSDMFEAFPPVHASITDEKLELLLIAGDVFQALVWLGACLIFFKAWRKLRLRPIWYSDLMWQMAGIFFCFFILSIIRIWGMFQMYLWIQGMVRVFVAIFGLYFLNTLYAARQLIYNPPTPEETAKKARLFEQIIKLMQE